MRLKFLRDELDKENKNNNQKGVLQVKYTRLTSGKGVYKPEKLSKIFPKSKPFNLCNYFCDNGFLKNVKLMSIWMNLFYIQKD